MFVDLTTTVRLGEIFLIVCQLLLSVTEIDSKSNIRHQVSTFKPEASTMKDDLTPMRVVVVNEKATLKKFLKRTSRKKRNFVNMVKQCCNLSINTTTSTCTPFFIRRSKMTHRKTTRLKMPIHLSTMQADLSANEPLLQKQEKGKIKKLLFAKHPSTLSSLFVTDSSEMLNGKNKSHHDKTTTNTMNLLGPSSEKIIFNKSGTTGVSTDGLNVTVNKNMITSDHPLSTKYNLRTVGMKTVLPIIETTSNYTTLEPFRAGSVVDGNLRTQVNHLKGSTISLTDLTNKTTNPFNVSESKADVILKKLHLKKIFHFKKASSFAPSESDRITAFESGKVSQYYNTLPLTHFISNKTTENEIRDDQVTTNNVFTYFLPNNTSQFKRLFHIHHKQRDFFTHCFTEKPNKINSAKPIMEQTTDILGTQIPSSSSQLTTNKEDNKSESDLSTTASPGNTSSDNESKYMHFRNMLHRQRRTTLDKVIGTTLKSHNFDSNFVSGSNFTSLITQSESECKTDSYTRGNENIMTRLFNFKKHKEGRESNHLTFEITGSKQNEVVDQSSIETTVDSKIISFDNSNNKQENNETTTVHNPFKIKYLMKFRSPIASTQSGYNNSSCLGLTSSTTYNDNKGLPIGKEHPVSAETTSEPMNTQDNLSTDLRASNQLDYDTIQCKLHRNHQILTKTRLQNNFSLKGQNITDTLKLESDASTLSTIQSKKVEETKESMKFSNIIGLRKYKTHGKNKNCKHNTKKPMNPRVRVSHKQVCCYKLSTEDQFKERFNVTVYRENSRQFRDWFFGKTTRPAINKGHQNEEECTFRWCFVPRFNNSRTVTKSSLLSTYPLNNTPETPTISGQKHTETFSKFPPEKKLKHFFHFKTSHIPLSQYSTTEGSLDGIKELINYTNPKQIQLNETSTKYHEKDHPCRCNNIVSHAHSPSSSVKPLPIELTPINSTTEILHSLEIVTLKSDLNSTDTVKPNVPAKVYGHGKVKQFFNRFQAAKKHFSNNTYNLKNNKNSSLLRENGTVILNQEYADYIETKVETKKHKKHSNRTVLHNASDVNDTSFNVMAYVMKPFDSLVSVFKALSPNSVTKIGDVNATDIKNGSLPNHLQPPNSSIVILAVNNTNATSRDVHESKLAMALDLLGGMYHCVFKSFFEAKPEDVHFYLYTRSSPEEPEELFLPPEPPNENVTDNADLPQPILETKMTTESSPMDKREVEDDEDDYEDYEFEALNPAKSEIQSKRFNVRAETKILIHGYLQDYQTDIMVSMKEAFLSRAPYNVVVVDWSVLVGDSSCYPVVASRGLRQVGGLLAQLLNRLVEAGVSPSTIHIVGFSLGAHVAGHAGTFLTHGLVSRITGLDPALPYVPMEPNMSLDSDDAVFVDIIHSAAGLLGQSGPMGHVDFYPNGGSQQPGCEVSSLSCSHRRAALYFIESINSDSGFQATKCESWHHFQADNCSYPAKVLMGEHCPANTSGKYYLVTGYKSPFALQPEEHIQVKKSLLLDLFYDSEDL